MKIRFGGQRCKWRPLGRLCAGATGSHIADERVAAVDLMAWGPSDRIGQLTVQEERRILFRLEMSLDEAKMFRASLDAHIAWGEQFLRGGVAPPPRACARKPARGG